ncbi:MAG: tyrosine--tRNA ligase [Thermoprotei archaeon]|nr:MAG: tyrosine--tRNA ligase [Thermoprotei archaeon]
MKILNRYDLVSRNAVEIITPQELRRVLEEKEHPKAYIGFEPSGLVHIGWLIWMYKIRDFVNAGLETYILEATWHAYINDKLGGDMNLIRLAARFVRKVLEAINVDVSRIKFVDAEDLVSDKEYWSTLIRSAKHVSLARVKRALTIMGRKAAEAETDFSKLIYPLMQVTDIFYLDLDIALGGTDQRKAHMLARDIAEKIGRKKVIAIHTPILTGLQGPGKRMEVAEPMETDEILAEYKMSKSKPETAIFVHDPPEKIREKIRRAYCPPRTILFNPIIEINKYILFAQENFVLHIDRPEKYGGPIDVYSFEELSKLYSEGKIHPLDLKNATAEALIKLLEPIRTKIYSDPDARKLLEVLSSAKITR